MTRPTAVFVAGMLTTCLALYAFSQKPLDTRTREAARINNLGAAYMNQQLFEKALKAFDEAAALDPKLEMARVNQGIALLNLAKIDSARPILELATKADPNDAHAWYNLGLLHKNAGDLTQAIEAFRYVTEIDSSDADTWYFLGASNAQNKQYTAAEEAFQRALKLNPQHASAEFGLARAFQQSGDLTHAREHLTRFQYITQNKLGSAITLAYGEQGKYSMAEESPLAPEKVPEQIKVTFVDVTKEAGLTGISNQDRSSDFSETFGPGACFLDYDNDGRIDLFLSDNGPAGGMTFYRNLGGKFEDVTKKAGLDPTAHGLGCTAGDYDNDGREDLAVGVKGGVLLLHNQKDGTFKDVTRQSGIRAQTGADVFTLLFIDYDHDGDLDLYVTVGTTRVRTDLELTPNLQPVPLIGNDGKEEPAVGKPPVSEPFPTNQMWRNNGNGTFTDMTTDTGLSAPGAYTSAVGTDLSNDRTIDVVATGWRGKTELLENQREGKFIPVPLAADSGFAVSVLDFDHDGWMDLAFNTSNIWRNNHGKDFDPIPLPPTSLHGVFGVAALDYDNDGWVDLVAVGKTKEGKGEIRLFRNLGPSGFKDVTADVGLDKIVLKEPRAVITGDYDNDGATDLLITQNHGPVVLLRNEGGNQNHCLRLNLKGLADNKSAIGTKVEVFAGGNRQKFEIAGSNGYLGQNSPYLTIGLGQAKQADIVRMLWPTGVLQDEIEVVADREQKFMEIDRRGSSCPTLFAWDGHEYKLVADMLGAGVVGHWVGPGQRNISRPTEYVKISREAIQEKDHKLSFRFMEPLEEAVYLDQVQLLAIDHHDGLEVYPNEYFASNPPYPEFKVVFSRDARPPAGAWDEHHHNVLPDLLAHRYFGDFEVLPFAGFTKRHTLELDLGEPYHGGPLWLLMHGEIEYFSATGMYAADQAGLQPIAPYVEALGKDGKWTRVIDDMGFPAGGPRMMTSDLSGKIPPGTRQIRISTNLQIYWDSILVDRTDQNQSARLTPVPLDRADLRFHGFPLKIEGKPPGNVKYVYEQASATGPYTRPAGAYTRYGDMLPLLKDFDDRLVVFGSGDEVALEFDPANLPVLPHGWARDYFYVAHGYEKDMDFYAYDFTQVDPLPFLNMGTYPYAGKSFPLDDSHLNYLLEYNTRYMSGNEARGFSFDYEHPR